jgi:hypothetical protein
MNVIKNSRVKANFEFLGNAGSVLGSIVDSTGTGITRSCDTGSTWSRGAHSEKWTRIVVDFTYIAPH